MLIFGIGVFSFGGITRQFYFNGFMFSLLALHQVRILDSSSLICVSSNDGCLLLMTRQVSSAESLGRQLVEFGKSFINNKNNNGSRDDPCATPYVIGSTFDLWPLIKYIVFDLKKILLRNWQSCECHKILEKQVKMEMGL